MKSFFEEYGMVVVTLVVVIALVVIAGVLANKDSGVISTNLKTWIDNLGSGVSHDITTQLPSGS